jgi:TadE-like protein
MKRTRQRGATLIEFTFVGIPLIFILVSVFEVSRGMWIYETLAYSVREGVRFAEVHGVDCVLNTSIGVNNNCQVAPSDIATVIQYYGVGLSPTATQVTFSVCTTSNCSGTTNVVGPCALNACPSGSGNYWPNTSHNQIGTTIRIGITTPFQSAIALFWPGAKPVSFTEVTLYANSTDNIKF